MLGSAMRRWRVKYSARPQAVAATNRPMKGEGPSPSMCGGMAWPIQPTAKSRIAAGDRDEDVVEAGQQPEMLLVDHRRLPPLGDEVAQRIGLLGGQRAAGDRGVEIAFAVHGSSLLCGLAIADVY